jgi:hypothetical protein
VEPGVSRVVADQAQQHSITDDEAEDCTGTYLESFGGSFSFFASLSLV